MSALAEIAEAKTTGDWERVIDIAIDTCLADPLTRRLIARMQTSGETSIHSAGDVLGERLIAIASFLSHDQAMSDDPAPLTLASRKMHIGNLALQASPYLWRTPVVQAVLEKPLPPHVISPTILTEPLMWWTFEDALPLRNMDGEGESRIDCVLVRDAGKFIEVLPLIDGKAMASIHLPYYARWPQDFAKTGISAEGFLKLLSFLNSPYIPKTHIAPTRSERRESLRRNHEDLPEVVFVDLRTVAHGAAEEATTLGRAFKHRWLVRGHHRAQWYPSESAHHVIWIAPYEKGPATAPLLTHVYRVKR